MDDRAHDLLRELGAVAAELGPAISPAGHDELLRSITEAARRLFGAAACSLALLDEEQEHLVFHVVSGVGADNVPGVRVPVGHGIAGWVVTSGQPLAVNDVSRDPRFARDVAEQVGYMPTSILAMPLETERSALGVIEVLDRRTDGTAGADDLELLGLFARQAALAIESASVFSDLGRALFTAVGMVTENASLTDALRRAAATVPPPRRDLAELAASIAALRRAGPAEQRLATGILTAIGQYAASREGP